MNIPNKTTQARPTQYFVDRQITPVVNIWPTPDNNNYQLVSYRIQRIDDVNSSAEDPEVPSRFIPCMVSGLAYNIALKKNPQKAALFSFDFLFYFLIQGKKMYINHIDIVWWFYLSA